MKFTLVQATYDRLDMIKVTIPFLLNQGFSPDEYEIIIVDYGITDGLEEFIEELKSEYAAPDIYYIPTKRESDDKWSRSIPVNIGIKHAKGDYILTVDSDCIYPLDTVYKYVDAYNKHFNRMVHGRYRFNVPENITKEILNDELEHITDLDKLERLCGPGKNVWMGAMQSFPREEAVRVGGMDERMYGWGHEDQEFLMRMERIGSVPVWANGIKVYHLWHPEQNEVPQLNYDVAAFTQHTTDYYIANQGRDWGMTRE